jgi:hypothetical protein
VAVFNTRKIAAQQTGFLFNITLRQALLQPVSANGGADLHGGASYLLSTKVYFLGSNQKSIALIVNMGGARMQ